MPSLWPPQRKPGRGVAIDWSNSLTRGMTLCVPFLQGAGSPVDLVNLLTPSTASSLGWGATPGGLAGSFNTSSIIFSGAPACGPAMSIFSLVLPTTWANNQAVITRATFNSTWQLFLISGSSIRWYGGSATQRINASSSGYSTVVPTALGISDTGLTTSAVAATLYVNGQSVATGLGTAGAAPVSNTNNIILGTYNGTSGYPFVGSHLLDIVWNRTLSADEHATLAANPWQIFRRHIPIEWMTGQASTTSVFFRRTLYDRAGSRGVA